MTSKAQLNGRITLRCIVYTVNVSIVITMLLYRSPLEVCGYRQCIMTQSEFYAANTFTWNE